MILMYTGLLCVAKLMDASACNQYLCQVVLAYFEQSGVDDWISKNGGWVSQNLLINHYKLLCCTGQMVESYLVICCTHFRRH